MPLRRSCLVCGRLLRENARAGARYCSSACRLRAARARRKATELSDSPSGSLRDEIERLEIILRALDGDERGAIVRAQAARVRAAAELVWQRATALQEQL